ncbi:hypothetical protein TRICI_004099 [Trichomonascus ciferrii]|uniref:Uncharacterized protein n=1 Tax=Trichomonascus ciferrii TaxID=44093 RepID=A0A642V1W3_9ASCO|nr:hypothetical protein TRICI_004099 [Trichomonascus ciferrii]
MESILSQYLLKQTSLRDFLPFKKFCELVAPPGSHNASIIKTKQLRLIYHALLNQDYDRQSEIEENLEGFLQQLRETELEQKTSNEEITNSSYNEINGYTKTTTIADPQLLKDLVEQLTDELQSRTSDLEGEIEQDREDIEQFVDSFNDLRYSSQTITDAVESATRELDDLHELINQQKT